MTRAENGCPNPREGAGPAPAGQVRGGSGRRRGGWGWGRTAARRAAALLAALAVAAAALASFLTPAAAQSQEEIDRMRRQIQQFQQQLERLQNQQNQTRQRINQLRNQGRQLESELARLDRERNEIEDRIAATKARLEEAERRLQEAQQALKEAEERLAHRNDLLARRVRAIAERGMVGYLEVLLSAQDFADFLSRFYMLRTIIDQDVTLLELARADREQVAELKARIEQEREQIVLLHTYLVEQKQEKEVIIARHQEMLDQVQSDYAAALALEEALERESQVIERELQRVQAELAQMLGDDPPFFTVWPVDRTGYYRLSSNFGMRWHPILRVNRMHSGVDFAKPAGSNIYAVASGVVVFAGVRNGYGNTVIIAHGPTLATLYAHAERILVSNGQQVQAGQVIAKVGSTGLATGPHLHFEVRKNGTPVDPMKYLNP